MNRRVYQNQGDDFNHQSEAVLTLNVFPVFQK
jgi:hypothetical protein